MLKKIISSVAISSLIFFSAQNVTFAQDSNQSLVIKSLVKSLVESNATSETGDNALIPFLNSIGVENFNTLKSKFSDARKNFSSQDFLEQKCGVRRNNEDTGSILGRDAGGSIMLSRESIISEQSPIKNLTNYDSFTVNGLTVNINYYKPNQVGKEYNFDVNNYVEKQKLIVRKIFNWWLPESLNLINRALGINFNDGRANTNTLTIKFENNYQHKPAQINVANDLGYASQMQLIINMYYFTNLTEEDKNGTLDKMIDDAYGLRTNYFDRIFLNYMTDLTLRANIPYFYNLNDNIHYGLIVIVGGLDDSQYDNRCYLDSLYKSAYGYSLLRWIAKENVATFSKVPVKNFEPVKVNEPEPTDNNESIDEPQQINDTNSDDDYEKILQRINGNSN